MSRSVTVRESAQRLANAIDKHHEQESITIALIQFASALADDLGEPQPEPVPQYVTIALEHKDVREWITEHPEYAHTVAVHAINVLAAHRG